jgi:hypothetical protein
MTDEKTTPRLCQSWWDWYLSPPEDWRKKYGDAFVWTEQEKMLMQQLKDKNSAA